jgi:hypothetical protein
VSAVLGKLGVGSREAAGRAAIGLGLATEAPADAGTARGGSRTLSS